MCYSDRMDGLNNSKARAELEQLSSLTLVYVEN